MNLVSAYLRQGQREYRVGARIAALSGASLIFLFGIPALLYWIAGTSSIRWIFALSPALEVTCAVVASAGLLFALWTVWVQFDRARGTPLPLMATQTLLIDGPYGLCRNPMALGALVFYFSVAVSSSSWKPVLAVFVFAVGLVAYIKLIEEKELALRFGDEYARYRKNTAFIFPRIPRARCG